MMRQRAAEFASSSRARAELEESTLAKSGKLAPTSMRKPDVRLHGAKRMGGGANLQPGDFGYGDPLQGKSFGGTTKDLAGKGKPAQEKTPPLFPGLKAIFGKKVDKPGTVPGDFGYGDILKGKKFGGTTKDLAGQGKPATDYGTRPGRR